MPPPDHDPVRDDADSFEEGEEEDAAALETEADVTCPHCGETMTITLDPGGGRAQEYVEDCQVCCRPWRVGLWDDAPRGVDVQLLPLEELLPPPRGPTPRTCIRGAFWFPGGDDPSVAGQLRPGFQ